MRNKGELSIKQKCGKIHNKNEAFTIQDLILIFVGCFSSFQDHTNDNFDFEKFDFKLFFISKNG
jgi:hypothetical protein